MSRADKDHQVSLKGIMTLFSIGAHKPNPAKIQTLAQFQKLAPHDRQLAQHAPTEKNLGELNAALCIHGVPPDQRAELIVRPYGSNVWGLSTKLPPSETSNCTKNEQDFVDAALARSRRSMGHGN